MPAVAEVEFKAVNAEGVVSAFESVGGAAQTSGQKIQENGSAMKQLGSGMKSGVGVIGNVATAFTALTLSVVNTWRSYRDLGDAQNQVEKANIRLTKATQAVEKQERLVAGLRKETTKGSKESAVVARKIQLAEAKLNKDRKEGKKSALEIAVAQDEINEMRHKAGTDASNKLHDAEQKLTNLRDTLETKTVDAERAQKRFNDTQQDFYLSIIPTGLGMLGSLASTIDGVRNSIGSGKLGLVGAFGGLGLVLGAGALAVTAYQNNWFGLRDAIGGVIEGIKARFGDWQKTVTEVFDLIRGGDWGGAFERIKKAAIAFWNDLVHNVPFFGGVAKLVDAIRQGKWDTAFAIIKDAAVQFWTDLKTAVPLLADAENFIIAFSQLKWGDMWKAMMSGWQNSGIPQLIESAFGPNWISGAQARIAQLQGDFSNMREAIKNANWKEAFASISAAMETSGLQDILDKLKPSIADVAGWAAGLVDLMAEGLEAVAGQIENTKLPQSMDDVMAGLNGAVDWVTHGAEGMGALALGMGYYLADQFLPLMQPLIIKTAKLTFGAQKVLTSIGNVGIEWVNALIKGIAANAPGIAIAKLFTGQGAAIDKAISEWEPVKPIEIPAEFDEAKMTADLQNELAILKEKLHGKPYTTVTFTPTLPNEAVQKELGKAQENLNKKTLKTPMDIEVAKALEHNKKLNKELSKEVIKPIKLVPYGPKNIGGGGAKGYVPGYVGPKKGRLVNGHIVAQHGFYGVVSGPTSILAGEAGRKERVQVSPIGSAGEHAKTWGGPGSAVVRIIFDPPEMRSWVRAVMYDEQGAQR